MALLGPFFKGRYKEGFHDAQRNGTAASDIEALRDKRIAGVVSRLYDSTTTGVASNTLNGFNMFKNPRVWIPLVIASACIVYPFVSGGASKTLAYFHGDAESSHSSTASEASSASDPSVTAGAQKDIKRSTHTDDVDRFQNLAQAFDHARGSVVFRSDSFGSVGLIQSGPLTGRYLQITGYVHAHGQLLYLLGVNVSDGSLKGVESADLLDMGYKLYSKGQCTATLDYKGQQTLMSCIPALVAATL